MRIGLIAPEYPPDLGGMAELARGMATSLATVDDVVVFTSPGCGLPEAKFQQQPVLKRDLRHDAELLRGADVDIWLALNAGLIPLAPRLEPPFFAFFMGNDFLSPWIPYGGAWERLEKPYAARLRSFLRRRTIRRSTSSLRGLLTISHRSAELMVKSLGVEHHRIRVHPPGVDDAFFQDQRESRGESLRLLTVSRLSQYNLRKNIDGVLRAVKRLEPRLSVLYTIVGDGDDRPRLETLARELGIRDRVVFRGAIAAQELLACYADADLFVLAAKASERDVEGFGIVYLEASASGVPVLGSREGGAIDAVADGRNGILISTSSPQCIAEGIESFSARRDEFSAARVRAFAEQFRWPKVTAAIRPHPHLRTFALTHDLP